MPDHDAQADLSGPRVSERLDKHAIRYRMNGLPYLLDEELELYGTITEPIWGWPDLTESDQAALRALAEGDYTKKAQAQAPDYFTPPRIFNLVLADYGIACPHFDEWRKVDDSLMFEECEGCASRLTLRGTLAEFFGGEFSGERRLLPNPPPPTWDFPKMPVLVGMVSETDPLEPSLELERYERVEVQKRSDGSTRAVYKCRSEHVRTR